MNSKFAYLLLLSVMAFAPASLLAESKQPIKTVEELIDQPVVAEGILCDLLVKGIGPRLAGVHDSVYLQFGEQPRFALDGRLVRVRGILRQKRVEKSKPGVQGFGMSFSYYVIDVAQYRAIERVAENQIREDSGEATTLPKPRP